MAHKISQHLKVNFLKCNYYLDIEATPPNSKLIDMQAFLDASLQKLACSEAFFN